ncbi:MAG TPA: glycerol kinase GlpK [Pirellulales bacterium]|nr:glycerol kinase GlpK [Pirellulales bacterium]
MKQFVLALDQGTTSSRAILFDAKGSPVASAQREFRQILPGPGIVEHDAEEIWSSQLAVARQAIGQAGIGAGQVAALGIANQRETTIVWDRETGRPVANAIVWQSRVSTPLCERLKREGLAETFRRKTGLVIDAYFSATKIAHLLDTVAGLRTRAEAGQALFGTVDSWLIWRLTGGKLHITDASNASRTLLYNIHTLDWDDELLSLVGVPRAMLPEVRQTSDVYGRTRADLFGGEIPIAAAAGDQQAATFGQACLRPGEAKNTYGTGCFLLLNTGSRPVESRHRLLSTIGWQIGGRTTYCLEGSVFIAGAAVQWLRDGLGLIRSSSEVEQLAATVPDAGGVYFVPAFVGLGAPHWDSHARGAIVGITRGTTAGHLARAALDAMAYQSRDLVETMELDMGSRLSELKVDGGASINDGLMQFQADQLGVTVKRPAVQETTALGAAYLAGLATGYWTDLAEIERNWALAREFVPSMSLEQREKLYSRWKKAVSRAQHWEESA